MLSCASSRAAAPSRASASVPRSIIVAVAIVTAALVVRGCQNDVSIVARYAAYFVFEILLPGAIALYLARVPGLSPSLLIALGVPTGFALELISFLTLSSLGARGALPWLPLGWVALAAWRYRRSGGVGFRLAFTSERWRAAAALAGIGLTTVIAAASQMYAESPLVDGLPQRPIFHDWIYLLSRAAVIKEYWPLQEPSLAGTPLQYHYFLLVHVASASAAAHVDVSWVLFRLAVVPLGFVLVTQAYVLGKRLARSRLAGVLAAALVVLPGEFSSAADYTHLRFLGHFVRWLYVSPTFFFGLVFFGALLLALIHCRKGVSYWLWLGLLAATGTGAKGSVLPVIIIAVATTAVWAWRRDRAFARRLFLATGVMALGFVVTYAVVLAGQGAGDPLVRPFEISRLTPFWQEHAIPIQRFLKRELHAPDFGTWLGATIVTLGIVAGTNGVRMLALPYLLMRCRGHRRGLRTLLVAVAVVGILISVAVHFDGDSELYFFLPQQLCFGVLAGACIANAWQSWRERLGRMLSTAGSRWRQWTLAGAGAAMLTSVVVVSGIQVVQTARCQAPGLRDWLNFNRSVAINEDLVPLWETTQWLRSHTEPSAVLLSNAFTIKTVSRGRGQLVDHTTAGVHYYYSALAERRVWIEGPTYMLDQAEAKRRLCESYEFFYRHKAPAEEILQTGPAYVVVDRSLHDNAAVMAAVFSEHVFHNNRFDVFRLNAGGVASNVPIDAVAQVPGTPIAQSSP